MEIMATYTKEKKDEMIITNYSIRNELDDKDVYDYSHIRYLLKKNKDKYSDEHYNKIIENRASMKVLDIFARQKIGKLTSEEEEMYSKYVNFDLDFLLFSDSDTLTLNTDNSGFITIFEDCTYRNTNTTDAHSETKKKQENWYLKTHHHNSDSRVLIYIFKQTATFYIPEDMNDYQKEELSSIVEEMDYLSKLHNKDLTIEVAVVNKDKEPLEMFQNLNKLKEYVINKKSKAK